MHQGKYRGGITITGKAVHFFAAASALTVYELQKREQEGGHKMKVKLLTDLTKYNSKFTRDAVGESTMHEYQREGQPWRTYVDVRIEGEVLPVGVEGVECLDSDYIRMKALQKKIEEKELLRQLKEAEKVIHAVGPAGGNKGIYLKTPWDDSLEKLASDNQECCNILSFCEKKKIRVTEVLHSELHKFK